ncbi:hypothetical protein J4482_04070 [Candidatus Woesearchaeota archaeon]|nr:hypothetical protein [Candidatus Woesearchaeota archaeon]
MKQRLMFGIIALLLLAMPFAFAQANTSVEAKDRKEYSLLERAIDRIKFAFTQQIERRLELINKIQERRQAHYQFLLEKGKTDQAERFNTNTIGLVKNFDQWKANKQDIIAKMEQNKTRERVEAPVQKQSGGKQ